MLAEASAGKFQSTRMGDPKRGEREDGGGRERAETIEIEAQPGIDLPEFLPPLIVDDSRGDSARAE